MFMMFLLSSYWGFKSLIPNWARIAVLIAGISQIVASYASLIDDTALHDIADTGAFLMLFFYLQLEMRLLMLPKVAKAREKYLSNFFA